MELEIKNLLKDINKRSRTIDMYHRLYQGEIFDKFEDVPILRKAELLEDQLRFAPFGSNLDVEASSLARVHRTSGSASRPLLLALTHNDINNVIRAGKKAFSLSGLSKEDTVINCMNYCMWMGGFMDHQSLEATGATVIPYGVGHTENLIELILSLKDVCIHATPSYLSKIETVAKEKFHISPKELGLKKGLFGGEGGLSDKNYRAKLEEKWGMDVYDANYGMSEVMSIIASEGEEKDGLHFTAREVLYPEIMVNGMASIDYIRKGAIGELVLSNLCKEAQPLFRYATGDVIEIIDTNGVGEFKFRVIGRSDEMIVVKGINFYPASLRQLISKYSMCTGIYQVQILDRPIIDQVKVKIEVDGTYELEQLKSCAEQLRKEIRSKLFILCDIEFETKLESGDNKVKLLKRLENW